MKFKDLEACPFCGCDEFYEKQQTRGTIHYRIRFDGKETDNTDMYDGLITTYSGRSYCENCNRYLGNYINDEVGKAAQRKCFENSLQNESQEVKDFFKNAFANDKAYKKLISKSDKTNNEIRAIIAQNKGVI